MTSDQKVKVINALKDIIEVIKDLPAETPEEELKRLRREIREQTTLELDKPHTEKSQSQLSLYEMCNRINNADRFGRKLPESLRPLP